MLRLVASYPEVEEIKLLYGLTIAELKSPLLEAIIENKEKIKTISLHFETGSNRLLTLVRKGHAKESAIELINIIRQEIPGIAIFSTMMIGLPTETLDDVDETVDLIRRTQIDGILCNYSPNHAIANLPQVSGNQKRRHLAYLINQLEQAGISHPLQIQLQGRAPDGIPGAQISMKGAEKFSVYNFGNQLNRKDCIPPTQSLTLVTKAQKTEEN